MKYQIIYLNGPSSVGKTTLAKALQEAFDPTSPGTNPVL